MARAMKNLFRCRWHRFFDDGKRGLRDRRRWWLRPNNLRWLMIPAALVSVLFSNPSRAIAQCEEPSDETYASLMQQATEAWDTEDYEVALEALTTADAQFDVAILSYSIARTLHFVERWSEADEAYGRFLRRFDGCPDPHGLVPLAQEYQVTAIRLANEEAARLAELEEQTESEGGISIPGITLLGTGGALLVSGLIFDLAKMGLQDELQEAIDNNSPNVDALGDERDTAIVVDWVLYSGGLVLATTGAILLLIHEDVPDEAPVVSVAPIREGAGLSLGFRF